MFSKFIRDYKKNERLQNLADDNKLRELYKTLPEYQNALGSDEFQQLRDQAFNEGPITQYELLRQQAQERQGNEAGRIQQALGSELQGIDVGQSGQLANAYSQLAMGGGLSSGARERLAAGGLEQSLSQRQGARFGADQKLFDLGATTREQMLGIGSDEAGAKLGMQQGITESLAGEDIRRQQFLMDQAKLKAQLESDILMGNRQVQAAEKSGSSGGGGK